MEQQVKGLPTRASAWLARTTALAMACAMLHAATASAASGTWLDDGRPGIQARQLLQAIEDSRYHGLDPSRYAVTDIDDRRTTRDADALAARFDDSFIRLATDLGRGMIDGRQVQKRLYRAAPEVDAEALLASIRDGSRQVAEVLTSLTPQHALYQRLTTHMQTLLQERDADVLRPRLPADVLSAVGDLAPEVMLLKRRLVQSGEMPLNTVLTPRFDAPTLVALQRFQKRHGLAQTRVLDEPTLTALNRSVEDDISDATLSLERLRWMPREFGERHLLVNLPDYRAKMRNGEQLIMDMPIVVGAVRHKTPVFSETLKYIEFNPTWTVPRSIAVNELLPRERRNPGYLAERNFRFKRWEDNRLNWVPLDEITDDVAFLRPFPYVLEQQPGKDNALGRMKFMMPNPYAIYLHDTPAQALFSERVRAYSHGCMRVSDPDRLASLLLQLDGYTHADATWLASRRHNNRVHLKTPVPVHVAYFTTWVDDTGHVQRRPDIYGHDAPLREALTAGDGQVASLMSDSAS